MGMRLIFLWHRPGADTADVLAQLAERVISARHLYLFHHIHI